MRFLICLLFVLTLAAGVPVSAQQRGTTVSTDTIFALEPHRAILSDDLLEVAALRVDTVKLGEIKL